LLAVLAERRAAEPILPPWFWRSRVLSGSAVAAFGLGLLVIGPTTFLPTYGQSVLGLGAVAAGPGSSGPSSTRRGAGSCTPRPRRCGAGCGARSAGSPRPWPGRPPR